MKFSQKKSQAALEFLTTYGWAFLIIIVLFAALAYFGILDPSKLLPSRCNFGSELKCEDFGIFTDGVILRLKNNLEKTIVIEGINVSTDRTYLECFTSFMGQSWSSDDTKDLPIYCIMDDTGFVQGKKEKLNIKLTYYVQKVGSEFLSDVQGEVYGAVRSGIVGGGSSSDPQICQNADDQGLCAGLDIVFGVGYQASCCNDFGLCC